MNPSGQDWKARVGGWFLQILLIAIGEAPSLALELNGQSYFTQPPWRVEFPDPPPPGSTLTVVLRPPNNPSLNDLYLFAVEALPAGPNPSAAPLGFARMEILDGWDR